MQKINIERMSPYIWSHMCKDVNSGEWGHFIDIEYGYLEKLRQTNRGRSISYPVLYKNKVYQPCYSDINIDETSSTPDTKKRRQYPKSSYEKSIVDNKYLPSSPHPIIYLVEKIVDRFMYIFYDPSSTTKTMQCNERTPLTTSCSLNDLANDPHITSGHRKPIYHGFIPSSANIYTINEHEHEDGNPLEQKNSMNAFGMITVSIMSMCAVYMLV